MTWEEFLQRLTRVSGTLPDGTRVWGTNAVDYAGTAPTAFFWKAVFYSRHGEFFTPDGTRPTVDTHDMRVALQLHKDAIVTYRVLPRTVDVGAMTGQGGWGNPATTQFAEGHYATIISGKFALASLRGFVEMQKRELARWEADPGRQRTEPRPEVLRIGVALLPHFPGRPFSCAALSQTVVINPASPHRDQALAFLRFLASDAYAQRVESYGIPGNPKHAGTDYPVTDPELAERELTRCEVESLRSGYQTRKSPFLLDFDVDRVLDAQVNRLEADPSLDCGRLLAEAQGELQAVLRLNLSRDPQLAAQYRRRAAHGSVASTP
jgi:ABC-type glycerol-3-phosphate transport system substrate-binding protein